MKTERKLENVVSELLRQAQSKRDFLTPAKRLHFAYDGPAPALEVDLPEGTESFPLRDTGPRKLAAWSFLFSFDLVILRLVGRTVERAVWFLLNCFSLSPLAFPTSRAAFRPLLSIRKQSTDRKALATWSYPMGRKLYVGNLTHSVASSDLREWFAQYGTVLSARVVLDREKDCSKGFGFVEMETDDQAQAAIHGLNEHEHEGRQLTVIEAKPRVARIIVTRREGSGSRRP
jgi:hypothetical protein